MEGRSAGVAHECRSAQPGSEPAVVPAAAMHVGAVPLHCRCIELTTLTVSSILLRSRPAHVPQLRRPPQLEGYRTSAGLSSGRELGPALHVFVMCALAPILPSDLQAEFGRIRHCSSLFCPVQSNSAWTVHARHAAAGAFRRAPARCLTTFSLFTPAARPAPHHEDRHLPARPPAARQRQVRCCAAAAAAVWCCRLSAALRRPWHALFGPLIAL